MKTGIKIINKLFWSVFVVVTFTTLSIGFSFRLWGLKGLVVPIIGCLIIFYLAVKIELVKKSIIFILICFQSMTLIVLLI